MTPQDNGYNPIRWNCLESGCFNWQKRPKIEMFAECFPGKISPGDIDGMVEIAGNALAIEWKESPMRLKQAEMIKWTRLTDDGRWTVYLLAGDPRVKNVTHFGFFLYGQHRDWKPTSIEHVKKQMKSWALHAAAHPRLLHIIKGA